MKTLITTLFIAGLLAINLALRGGNVENCAITLTSRQPIFSAQLRAGRSFECVDLEIANTPAARQAGLSGRRHLESNQGMLFDFKEPQRACIWMKDMNFSIDIIWLDQSKEIIKILENVNPDTYPESFCADNTAYVVELAASVAEQAGLRVGQQLKI